MNEFAAVILAAGASSRMGEPKQLLSWQGSTFLEHTMKSATGVFGGNICIVLGANAENVLASVSSAEAYSVVNDKWKAGMGSSIALGLKTLLNRFPGLSAVLFMTVDQPFVSSRHLSDMLDKLTTSGKAIVASSYGDTLGIPALFGRQFFDELLLLESDKGAKEIITRNSRDTALLALPSGEIDIDTPKQYSELLAKQTGG